MTDSCNPSNKYEKIQPSLALLHNETEETRNKRDKIQHSRVEAYGTNL